MKNKNTLWFLGLTEKEEEYMSKIFFLFREIACSYIKNYILLGIYLSMINFWKR